MSGAISATTLGIIGGIGAAGSVAGGLISSNAAKDAASTQASAADRAAQLQYQASQEGLQFEKDQYADSQKNLAPWLNTGKDALSNLAFLSGVGSNTAPAGVTGGYGDLLKAPSTADFMANDPGYQARLKLGSDTLQRSAAARGNLLTGGTAKALDQYSQDYASNEYNNYFNRYQTNQNNQYNKLAALSGVGQQAGNTLTQAGQSTANGVSTTLANGANAAANGINNAAAANASGIVGGANAWGGALSGATGNLNNLLLLQKLMGNRSGVLPGGGGSAYNGSTSYMDDGTFFG